MVQRGEQHPQSGPALVLERSSSRNASKGIDLFVSLPASFGPELERGPRLGHLQRNWPSIDLSSELGVGFARRAFSGTHGLSLVCSTAGCRCLRNSPGRACHKLCQKHPKKPGPECLASAHLPSLTSSLRTLPKSHTRYNFRNGKVKLGLAVLVAHILFVSTVTLAHA